MYSAFWRFLPLVGMAVLVSVPAGCGAKAKPTGTLQGTVTFDGAPVAEAMIQIRSPQTGEAAGADLDSAGKFVFPNPVSTGEYLVSVSPKIDIPDAGSEGLKPKLRKPVERKDIPDKYRDPTKSGVKTNVQPGDNTLDVKMTK